MNETSILKFGLRFADGRKQELTVDAPTVLIGSGSHCEIRLPAEDAAVEQLLITTDAAGLSGQVRSLERSVTLNGVPFVEGRLLPDSLLCIGRVELIVSVVETAVTRSVGPKKGSDSRGIYILAAIGFPLGFYLIFTHRRVDPGLPAEVEPPVLFAASSGGRCVEQDRAAAMALGMQELRRGETARERAPFSGQDAVGSVDAFQRASACFSTAASPERASDAAHQAELLKKDVEGDFHVHRVRLERALATKRYEDARTEVRLLLSYVGRHSGAYANWLTSLDRQIELKFSGKKQK